jgi:hypothetical protein
MGQGKKLTQVKINRIVRRYLNGERRGYILRTENIDTTTLSKYLKQRNVANQSPHNKPTDLPRHLNKAWKGFRDHRNNARHRNIAFLLTFDQWLAIWRRSGKLHLRGRSGDQYVMARKSDRGPYAIGNVKIITNAENTGEGQTHKKYNYNTLARKRSAKAHSLFMRELRRR